MKEYTFQISHEKGGFCLPILAENDEAAMLRFQDCINNTRAAWRTPTKAILIDEDRIVCTHEEWQFYDPSSE